MTITTNPSLTATLAACSTKLDWASALNTALGTTRRLRCFRDANAAASDPFTSGTEFLNVGASGPLGVSAGNIVDLGILSGVTVRTAVDLASGSAVLRIEGNGNWIQGTLGLTGASTDFVFTANLTATAGVTFKPGAGIKAPLLLNSGTGPLSPLPDANTPAYVIIENWTGDVYVGEAGRIQFDRRIQNWVFDHPEIAAEMGDIRVTQTTTPVTYGAFEFGATLFAITPTINADASVPWYQVLIGWKPTEANWPGYPRASGYKKGTRTLTNNGETGTALYGISDTFAPPFKARICRADGTTLFLHEMPKDHLPINSSQLSEVATINKPVRPHMHCGSMLPWSSARPKMSSKAAKYNPGVHPRSLKPNIGKGPSDFNGIYPMVYDQQANSFGHWYYSAKWGYPANMTFINNDTSRATDPYAFDVRGYSAGWGIGDPWKAVPAWYGASSSDFTGAATSGGNLAQGWGYEPGAHMNMDHQSWPGGSRIDRQSVATPHMIHATDPTWVHAFDNTPIQTMVDHWNLGYFNYAWHTITNAATFDSIPVNEVLAGDWSDGNGHYAGNDSYTDSGPSKAISQFVGLGQGSTMQPFNLPHGNAWVDANFRMPWNGEAIDNLHNYQNPGYVARVYNSPMHAFSTKLRYLRSIMCQAGGRQTYADGPVRDHFMIRVHAWRMLHHNEMWTLASDHPVLGISRKDVEARIIAELSAVYTQMYIPLFVTNDQSAYFTLLRNFAVPVRSGSFTDSFALTFYLAMVMQQWKQSGLFRRMWDYSDVTQKALLCIIKVLDAGGIAFFSEINGVHVGLGGGEYGGGPNMFDTNGVPFTSWDDYVTRGMGYAPGARGQADFVHDINGNLVIPDSGEYLRAQWPFIRKYYFSDIPCAYNVDLACTRVDGYYAAWDARIAAMDADGRAKSEVSRLSWNLFPHLGRPVAPTVLGA